jgi:chromosomal replication initiation ATPase DnaA
LSGEKLSIHELRKLEEIVNAVLDNFPEEVERITQAIKEAALAHFENALDRLFLAGFIQNIIADYFGDKLVEDVLIISFEEVKEESLH